MCLRRDAFFKKHDFKIELLGSAGNGFWQKDMNRVNLTMLFLNK